MGVVSSITLWAYALGLKGANIGVWYACSADSHWVVCSAYVMLAHSPLQTLGPVTLKGLLAFPNQEDTDK